jgi:hypothetical protein
MHAERPVQGLIMRALRTLLVDVVYGQGRACSTVRAAHEGPINAMSVVAKGGTEGIAHYTLYTATTLVAAKTAIDQLHSTELQQYCQCMHGIVTSTMNLSIVCSRFAITAHWHRLVSLHCAASTAQSMLTLY